MNLVVVKRLCTGCPLTHRLTFFSVFLIPFTTDYWSPRLLLSFTFVVRGAGACLYLSQFHVSIIPMTFVYGRCNTRYVPVLLLTHMCIHGMVSPSPSPALTLVQSTNIHIIHSRFHVSANKVYNLHLIGSSSQYRNYSDTFTAERDTAQRRAVY